LPLIAASVYINDPNVTLNRSNPSYPTGVVGPTIWQTKYRISAGGFDLSMSPYGGTGTAGTTWLGSNTIGNAGNVAGLTGTMWDFQLTNSPGHSLQMSMTRLVAGIPTTITEVWGPGCTGPLTAPSGCAATLNGPGGIPYQPQDRAFNTLRIQARSTSAGHSATITALSFVSPSFSPSLGSAFQDMTVTSLTPRSGPPTFPADAAGYRSQWLIANGNFATANWTLSGKIVLNRPSGGSTESVRVTFSAMNTLADLPAEIPEPSTQLLAIAGLAAVAACRLSRRPLRVLENDTRR